MCKEGYKFLFFFLFFLLADFMFVDFILLICVSLILDMSCIF